MSKEKNITAVYERPLVSADGGTDWSRLEAMTDEDIEAAAVADPDNPGTTAEFWKDAEVVAPGVKEPVSIRLDRDLLDWFRAQGRGYQTRINAVLRAHVEARRKAG